MTVAERRPVAEGSNVTSKVVDPPIATVVAGAEVTVKSAALVPEIAAPETFRTAEPVFWMV